MALYLGVDASTQSMTGLVIDTQAGPSARDGGPAGRIVAEASINFDAHLGQAYGVANGVLDMGGGVVHSAPLMWAEALDRLFETLRDKRVDLSAIRAVAGSGQQHGTVYLNATAAAALSALDGARPLRDQLAGILSRKTAPIWMDTSTGRQCREIEAGVGGRDVLLRLTGNAAFERFSGPQIRKFSQEDPPAYAATACICLVSSFVASLLAGRLVPVDAGDGSGTNLMDIAARRWSPRALDATAPRLAERLLPVAPSSKPLGPISPYYVRRYGFDHECLVLPFSGDNPCSLIGLGLVAPGRVALSLGTSDTLFACMAEPRVSEQGEGCLFASPDDRHYMALICFLNGSLAREAVRARYGLDWGAFGQALRDTAPGNGGALMLPYFAPEIVPKVARAGVVRRNLPETDPKANVRAVIEAQALSSRIHSRWMGVDITSLYVTGGASANEQILKVYADVHGCPVHRFETTSSAALGAALRAHQGHHPGIPWRDIVAPFTEPAAGSTIAPDPAARKVYEGLVRKYETLEKEQ